MNPENKNNGRKPDFIAKSVSKDEKTGADRWTDIGVCFSNPRTQSITVKLNALPADKTIVLMPPKEKPQQPKQVRSSYY